MNDKSKSPDNSDAAVKPKAATDAAREPIPRPIYVTMRLKELTEQVAEMTGEREKLRAQLKAPEGHTEDNRKALRYRIGYLTKRLALSKQERTELAGEKTAQRSARAERQKRGKKQAAL